VGMFEASWVPRGSGGPIKTLVRFLPAVDVVYVLSWLLGLTLGPPTAAAPDRRPTRHEHRHRAAQRELGEVPGRLAERDVVVTTLTGQLTEKDRRPAPRSRRAAASALHAGRGGRGPCSSYVKAPIPTRPPHRSRACTGLPMILAAHPRRMSIRS
jgi:hypothetical protein